MLVCHTTLQIQKFVSCLGFFSLVLFIDNVATPAAASREHDNNHSTQPMTAAKAAPDSARKSESSTRKIARPHVSLSQRRERHNSKERERR